MLSAICVLLTSLGKCVVCPRIVMWYSYLALSPSLVLYTICALSTFLGCFCVYSKVVMLYYCLVLFSNWVLSTDRVLFIFWVEFLFTLGL